MKKQFTQSFLGAFIGIIVYEAFLNFEEPFDTYWANYTTELGLTILCIFSGVFMVGLILEKISIFNSKTKA